MRELIKHRPERVQVINPIFKAELVDRSSEGDRVLGDDHQTECAKLLEISGEGRVCGLRSLSAHESLEFFEAVGRLPGRFTGVFRLGGIPASFEHFLSSKPHAELSFGDVPGLKAPPGHRELMHTDGAVASLDVGCPHALGGR